MNLQTRLTVTTYTVCDAHISEYYLCDKLKDLILKLFNPNKKQVNKTEAWKGKRITDGKEIEIKRN